MFRVGPHPQNISLFRSKYSNNLKSYTLKCFSSQPVKEGMLTLWLLWSSWKLTAGRIWLISPLPVQIWDFQSLPGLSSASQAIRELGFEALACHQWRHHKCFKQLWLLGLFTCSMKKIPLKIPQAQPEMLVRVLQGLPQNSSITHPSARRSTPVPGWKQNYLVGD